MKFRYFLCIVLIWTIIKDHVILVILVTVPESLVKKSYFASFTQLCIRFNLPIFLDFFKSDNTWKRVPCFKSILGTDPLFEHLILDQTFHLIICSSKVLEGTGNIITAAGRLNKTHLFVLPQIKNDIFKMQFINNSQNPVQ